MAGGSRRSNAASASARPCSRVCFEHDGEYSKCVDFLDSSDCFSSERSLLMRTIQLTPRKNRRERDKWKSTERTPLDWCTSVLTAYFAFAKQSLHAAGGLRTIAWHSPARPAECPACLTNRQTSEAPAFSAAVHISSSAQRWVQTMRSSGKIADKRSHIGKWKSFPCPG